MLKNQIAYLSGASLAALLFFVPQKADAFLPRGVAVNPACPQPGDGGCAASPGGQFKLASWTAFSNIARLSGQNWLASRPPVNYCGIDYGCGQISPDASLTTLVIGTGISPSPGCSYFSTNIRCNNTGFDIEGYLFQDLGIDQVGSSASSILKNNHFVVGANICNKSTNLVAQLGPIDAESNTFSFDETVCTPAASLFGQTNDPGLTVNSTGTATVSGTSIVYTGTPTGLGIRVNQYIHCAGCTGQARVTAYNAGTFTATVSVSQPSLGSGITVTTGPQEPRFLGAIGGSMPSIYRYNVASSSLGFGDMATTGGCDIVDAKYNYWFFGGDPGAHENLIQIQPSNGSGPACTIPSVTIDNNTVVWSPYATGGTGNGGGTGTVGMFTTLGSPPNAYPGGYQMTTTTFEASNNILGGNTPINNPSGFTTAFQIRTTGQIGTAHNTVTVGTINSSTMTVTAFVSGASIIPGDTYACTSLSGGCQTLATPIQVISQLTGTGGAPCPDVTCDGTTGTYQITYTSGSRAAATMSSYLWNGIVTNSKAQNNYVDNAGSQSTIQFDNSAIPVTNSTVSGNINLQTGASWP